MERVEQLIRLAEGQKQSMAHFVEHMSVILNNVEDNLTRELLSHLIEEEHERALAVDELIQSLRGLPLTGVDSVPQGELGGLEANANGGGVNTPVGITGSRRPLSVGSLVIY
ncbi:hypothetical protein [Effusibacillus lacus]|uniref:Uncharacterized protein n=1 Tax=Effusibacillus lacus TaxID=1348429 RepID=A0A292YMD6_9BACL|nr:hypothetical protein [Effusibacillus lacus]TCS71403.1 hypothetical protein EDD64_12621 [Effusibacillus lacus]GAX89933.1 hypothetical protein EFBL_1559 [Effusibacillus lacus]